MTEVTVSASDSTDDQPVAFEFTLTCSDEFDNTRHCTLNVQFASHEINESYLNTSYDMLINQFDAALRKKYNSIHLHVDDSIECSRVIPCDKNIDFYVYN